jgi:hypothetical protein
LVEHQRDLVLHAQEHTAEVDGDHPVPFVIGEIGRGRYRLFDARVVEGGVDTPERFDRLIHCSLHVVALGHVARDRGSQASEPRRLPADDRKRKVPAAGCCRAVSGYSDRVVLPAIGSEIGADLGGDTEFEPVTFSVAPASLTFVIRIW